MQLKEKSFNVKTFFYINYWEFLISKTKKYESSYYYIHNCAKMNDLQLFIILKTLTAKIFTGWKIINTNKQKGSGYL